MRETPVNERFAVQRLDDRGGHPIALHAEVSDLPHLNRFERSVAFASVSARSFAILLNRRDALGGNLLSRVRRALAITRHGQPLPHPLAGSRGNCPARGQEQVA